MTTGLFVLKTACSLRSPRAELGEFRTAVIDGRLRLRAEPGRGRPRARDLKEVPSGMKRHG